MVFLVGGYDEPNSPYGRVFEVKVPANPSPTELIPGQFGVAWGGQKEFTERLLHGFDSELPTLVHDFLNFTPQQRTPDLENMLRNKLSIPIPYQFLPLQDCVDLSIFLVRTTMTLQKWLVGIRGVGGAIDVATITRIEGCKPIQQKQILGERII